MKKDMIQLMSHTNEMWNLMEDNYDHISGYWENGKSTSLISKLIADALGLILCQLLLKREEYKKYLAKTYFQEDFVDMLIDMVAGGCPSMKDTKAYAIYIEDTRKIIWGHIKTRGNRIAAILKATHNFEMLEDFITDDDIEIFDEALMVVYMECLLRKSEAVLLEGIYEC